MKIFFTIIFCLCAIYAYPQASNSQDSDGTYVFKKAVLTIYNANTKAEVSTETIDNVASLNMEDIHLRNVLLQATIYQGVLSFCILPDNLEYAVQDGIQLVPMKVDAEKKTVFNQLELGNAPESMQLKPYTFTTSNNVLTLTSNYSYGDSTFDFPLEGKLTIMLTKQ